MISQLDSINTSTGAMQEKQKSLIKLDFSRRMKVLNPYPWMVQTENGSQVMDPGDQTQSVNLLNNASIVNGVCHSV